MIKIKTAENTLTDIAEVYVKTSANTLTKIAEGYQVTEQNGVKALTPIYTSECKHNFVVVSVSEATCTEDGYTTYECTKCGSTYSEQNALATGHDFVEIDRTEPTCMEYGVASYGCSVCGEHMESPLDPTGEHSDNGAGYCSVCGELIEDKVCACDAPGDFFDDENGNRRCGVCGGLCP